jgi:DNA-binding transcriptional MerR regulator
MRTSVSWVNPIHQYQESGVKQEFSIKDLEHLTGVKAHTIRMWEQRYNLLNPDRSATNIRTYSGHDLKRLLNVSLLVERGLKISKVATMADDELTQEVLTTPREGNGEALVAQQRLKVSMMSFDEHLFRDTMAKAVNTWGFEGAVMQVCLPFLAEVGVLWLTNAICPAHEHFMSNLYRQMMFAAVDATPLPASGPEDKVYVLYLPEREIHDISLLFVHQILRNRGMHSIFLGQSVPFDDLQTVASQFPNAHFVSYCTTYPAEGQAQEYIDRVNRTFGGSSHRFHLAGGVFQDVQGGGCVTVDRTGGGLIGRICQG